MTRASRIHTAESSRLQCGKLPGRTIECSGLKELRDKHGAQAGCEVSQDPDPMLAYLLLDIIPHAPGPPPVTCITDVTTTVREQDPGRAPRGSMRAVYPALSGADRAARSRGRDEKSPLDAWLDSAEDGSC